MPGGARAGAPRPERSMLWRDRLLGALGVVAVLGGLAAAVAALRPGPPAPPRAHLLGLAVRDTSRAVVFAVDRPLRRTPQGWSVGPWHLHLALNSTILMPGPRDLVPLGGGRYRWPLPPLPPGRYWVRLVWSDSLHRTVSDGASAAARLVVAP